MKTLAVALAIGLSAAVKVDGRTVTALGGGWTADGEPVTVPHSWNLKDATLGENRAPDWNLVGYSSGATSYVRKAVSYRRALPDPKSGRRYFVKCDGAAVVTTVKVNGRTLGKHVGAFTAFAFEATEAMKPTGNELEMLVDSRFDPDVQPIHADFSVYGGLYRTPYLIETGPVCIDPVTDGACGVRIAADARSGEVTAQVAVLGGTNEVQRFRFDDFEPWSPENPKLYTVNVRIAQRGSVDEIPVRFGFRTAEFREDGLFYLNGKVRKIRGVCRHQDREGRGWCRDRADEAEDVRWIKLMGADGVRTAHYPQSPNFLDLCDENGIMVWEEAPNVNGFSFSEAARKNMLNEAREMVMQHVNHPSIVMWGLFNELYNYRMKEGVPEARMAELNDSVKKLDPSRPTTGAMCRPHMPAMCAVPDAIGFNLYPGGLWARGLTPDDHASNMTWKIHNAFTNNPARKALCVSEYGVCGSMQSHRDARFRGVWQSFVHPEEYQAYLHRYAYEPIAKDPRVWGSFAWVMFDLASNARQEGTRNGINDKGLVTWDRMSAKDAFYFYKTLWNPEPELHLVGYRATETTNRFATVLGFSNVGRVTLTVNGRVVGEKTPDDMNSVIWEGVELRNGDNLIQLDAGSFRKVARWRRHPPAFPKVSKARAITSGPKDHLLASYFAINSWSRDNRYVLVLETEVNGRLSAENEPCTLGVVDTEDNNRFIPIAETRAWNFQEAAMAHWLPWGEDMIAFNDYRDGKFVAVVMNWKTKQEARVIPHPIAAVSPDGKKAISLNYARIRLTRPDYGYAGRGQDPLVNSQWPDDDGLWYVDLMTGDAKLIVPISGVRGQAPEVGPKGLFYFCHTVFSKDGQRVFWLARGIDWYDPVKEKAGPWSTTAFTCRVDGSEIRPCFPDPKLKNCGGSHFNWLDDRTMVVTIYPRDEEGRVIGGWHVEFTVGDEEKSFHRLAPQLLDWDGHCVYSPNGKWISTEGYFDKTYLRNWVLVRREDEACLPIGSFYVPEAYRGGFWRCDLHGRWRPDGKQLGFNSAHEGSRQVYVMDVEEDE